MDEMNDSCKGWEREIENSLLKGTCTTYEVVQCYFKVDLDQF